MKATLIVLTAAVVSAGCAKIDQLSGSPCRSLLHIRLGMFMHSAVHRTVNHVITCIIISDSRLM